MTAGPGGKTWVTAYPEGKRGSQLVLGVKRL